MVKKHKVALENWGTLNRDIMDFSVEELVKLLNIEGENRNRRTFIVRIHQRLSHLRGLEERKTLVRGTSRG